MGGFVFKPWLALVSAVVNGLVASLTYLATADPRFTIVASVVVVGLTEGMSYYKGVASGQQ